MSRYMVRPHMPDVDFVMDFDRSILAMAACHPTEHAALIDVQSRSAFGGDLTCPEKVSVLPRGDVSITGMPDYQTIEGEPGDLQCDPISEFYRGQVRELSVDEWRICPVFPVCKTALDDAAFSAQSGAPQ